MQTNKDRLAYIDALRGWAILGVILTHAADLANVTGRARQATDAAGNGVLLFFVVSACTIFMTLTNGVVRETAPYRNFFIKRFMRLMPVYWSGMLIYTLVYGLASRGWKDGPEIWHYPMHATLTNLLHPAVMSSVVPGGWSISCEAMFYLTVPLWFCLIRSWKAAALLVVVSADLGTLWMKAAPVFLDPLIQPSGVENLTQFWYRSFPAQMGTFAFGILVFFLTRDRPAVVANLSQKRENLAALAIAAIVLVVQTFHPLPIVGRQYVFGFGFMIAALALSQIPWGPIVNRASVGMGKISYSSYLVHFLALRQLNIAIPQGEMNPLAYTALLMALGMPITIAAAYCGYRWIEKPTTLLAKRWIKRLEGLPPTPSAGGLKSVA